MSEPPSWKRGPHGAGIPSKNCADLSPPCSSLPLSPSSFQKQSQGSRILFEFCLLQNFIFFLFFKKTFYSSLFHVCGCFAYMWICIPHICTACRGQKGAPGPAVTRVLDGYEPPCRYCELKLSKSNL